MKLVRTAAAVAFAAIACFVAACGSESKPAVRTATPTATAPTATSPTATATRTIAAPASTNTPLAPSETAIAATPQAPAAQSTATLAPDRKFELAPIDGAEIVVEESFPVQYAVHITSGLPSGCAQFADATASRAGVEIAITVRNTLPANGQIACTQIYGTHETTVQLGSDFARGTTYRVRVNDRTLEFTAQ
jgi:hypothetical protein